MGIEQAFAGLKERIKPAVLEPTFDNGVILRNWCVQNGINFDGGIEQEQIDALVRAATAQAYKLSWQVKPKKLTGNNDHNTTPRTARQEAEDFAAKTKKEEEQKEYAKTQESAARSISSLIDAIQFKDASGTRIAHGKTDSVKEVCKKHLSKALAANRDLRQVHKELVKYVTGEYEKAEKAKEQI